MKTHSSAEKALRQTRSAAENDSADRADAATLAPPGYGIDFVDRGMAPAAGPAAALVVQRASFNLPASEHVSEFEDRFGYVWLRDSSNDWYRADRGADDAKRMIPQDYEDFLGDVDICLEWTDHQPLLGRQIADTFAAIGLPDGGASLAITRPLMDEIALMAAPIKNNQTTNERRLNSVREHLAELQHAASIIDAGGAEGAVDIGAHGPVTLYNDAGEATGVRAEDPHGLLPPLEVADLEADAYYVDNVDPLHPVLHLDEVKINPGALHEKLHEGKQAARHVEWLNKATPGGPRRQVGYIVANTGPGFDKLLSPTAISRLKAIEALNREKKFITIGPYTLSATSLEGYMASAVEKLNEPAFKAMYTEAGLKFYSAGERYFGDMEEAINTLMSVYG